MLVAAMLSGCAVLPESEPAPDPLAAWERRRRRLAGLEGFAFSARLALRTARDAMNARIRWKQAGDEYRIRLGGPIGEAALELRGGADGVELRGPDGVYRADSPEALLHEHAGWSVPLQALRYWVLGIATPGTALEALELDRRGRPAHLVQTGWRIVYRRYTTVQEVALPERIDLDRAGLETRLVVSRWTLGT